ncbi:MAG TPA: hypothetical protein VGH89_19445 [Pseudonocardia sp.]
MGEPGWAHTGCTGRHTFGPWRPCACGQAIADHEEFSLDGPCAFSYRSCQRCCATQERHNADRLIRTF